MPITFVSQSTDIGGGNAVSNVVPALTGLQANDLLIGVTVGANNTPLTPSQAVELPSGFTPLLYFRSSIGSYWVGYKWATAGESQTYTFTWSTGANISAPGAAVFAYRGVSTQQPFGMKDNLVNAASATYTAPAVDTFHPGSWILRLFQGNNSQTSVTVSNIPLLTHRAFIYGTPGTASNRRGAEFADEVVSAIGQDLTATVTGVNAVNFGSSIVLNPSDSVFSYRNRTYFMKDEFAVNGGAHLSLGETVPSPDAQPHSPSTGWNVDNTAPPLYSLMKSHSTPGGFVAEPASWSSSPPTGLPNNIRGDSFRTSAALSGTFYPERWKFVALISALSGATISGKIWAALYKGRSPDGSDSTLINSGETNEVDPLVDTDYPASMFLDNGTVSMDNEFLFARLAWRVTAVGGTVDVIDLNAGSMAILVTPPFFDEGEWIKPDAIISRTGLPQPTSDATALTYIQDDPENPDALGLTRV